jgi:hypothetical protein
LVIAISSSSQNPLCLSESVSTLSELGMCGGRECKCKLKSESRSHLVQRFLHEMLMILNFISRRNMLAKENINK